MSLNQVKDTSGHYFQAPTGTDQEIFKLIELESKRQEEELCLIASENYTDPAVLAATGSILTNKYAEGYPGKRYYGGCAIIDEIEQLAIDRAKKLFNAEHANVQPHSGSQANMGVFHALLTPGDTILGMDLAAGGHLTHGHPANFSGKLYKIISYSVNPETGLIDYDEIEKMAQTHRPKLIIAGASAYSRTIDFERFGAIAKKYQALLMVDMAHIAGLVAAGIHPNPFPHADIVTSTTHKTLRGPRGGFILCKKEYATAIDKALMPGIQGGPLMHVIAAKAIAFGLALQPEFALYQKQIYKNTQAMIEKFNESGYQICANGSDNHLFILDLRNKGVTGKEAESALEKAGLTVSRSCIPHDPQKPWITSGIRIGSAAITTRGLKEQDAQKVAELVDLVISNYQDQAVVASVKAQVKNLAKQFPIYNSAQF